MRLLALALLALFAVAAASPDAGAAERQYGSKTMNQSGKKNAGAAERQNGNKTMSQSGKRTMSVQLANGRTVKFDVIRYHGRTVVMAPANTVRGGAAR